jgi:hypothetical protein
MTFDELSNPWSEYLLPDGRKMRVRHILMNVVLTGSGADEQLSVNFAPPIVWIEPISPEDPLAESAPKGHLQ